MADSSIVVSPAWKLTKEDLQSALTGLGKMVIGTTIVFVAGILGNHLNDPAGLLKENWIGLGTAYLMLQLSSIITFVYNILIKWIKENKYVAS